MTLTSPLSHVTIKTTPHTMQVGELHYTSPAIGTIHECYILQEYQMAPSKRGATHKEPTFYHTSIHKRSCPRVSHWLPPSLPIFLASHCMRHAIFACHAQTSWPSQKQAKHFNALNSNPMICHDKSGICPAPQTFTKQQLRATLSAKHQRARKPQPL